MSSLDHWIAQLSHRGGAAIALLVALLLGLRHATDPDHVTAVSTLALSDQQRGGRRAGVLGLSWGLGHATTLVLFGLPALLLRTALPHAAQRAAEALIGLVIAALAARLLHRWRHGYFHSHPHRHGERWHVHPHAHEDGGGRSGGGGGGHGGVHGGGRSGGHGGVHGGGRSGGHGGHEHRHEEALGRSPLAAYGIGLIHGMGGSAAVTVLLIGAIPDRAEATIALVLFALATALSMFLVSAAFGSVIASRRLAPRLESAVPLLGVLSLAFGVFYGVAAV
jgi:hypothetical protein